MTCKTQPVLYGQDCVSHYHAFRRCVSHLFGLLARSLPGRAVTQAETDGNLRKVLPWFQLMPLANRSHRQPRSAIVVVEAVKFWLQKKKRTTNTDNKRKLSLPTFLSRPHLLTTVRWSTQQELSFLNCAIVKLPGIEGEQQKREPQIVRLRIIWALNMC